MPATPNAFSVLSHPSLDQSGSGNLKFTANLTATGVVALVDAVGGDAASVEMNLKICP